MPTASQRRHTMSIFPIEKIGYYLAWPKASRITPKRTSTFDGFRPLKITRRTGARRPLSRARAADAAHLSPWPEKISRKNRNTFSTSRKIDAASSGAVAMSVLVRSRWKSNMVNPAKMTRPRTE